MRWAYQKGITGGTSDTLFSPDRAVTREQVCTFIYRCCNLYGVNLPDRTAQVTFTDQSSISSWALAAVTKLQTAGVVTGYSDGTFLPQREVKREEAATFFYRVCTYAA